MNRKEEYRLIIEELEQTPIQLEYTIQRAEARKKKKWLKNFFAIPTSSCLAFLMIFTILVNCVPVFAHTCGNIPVLKELAQLVAFSPSLSAAVENKYVQPIEMEQTLNDITVRIEYLIVDQKQLNIVYSLDSKIYTAMDATPSILSAEGEELVGYCMSLGKANIANGELNYITVDFIDNDMPSSLYLKLEVYDNGSRFEVESIEEKKLVLGEKATPVYTSPKVMSEFTFKLEFDPYYTAQGENINLQQTFMLDGQTFILEGVEIYPTHMRLMLNDIEENIAWLKSLMFYVENEKGEQFNKIGNGITATGKEDSPMMASHRLESAFFSDSKELTMYITGVEWLDKDKERVKLDLKNVSAEWLPEGVSFEAAERQGRGWLLTFDAREHKEGVNYQIWAQNYYNEEGNEYTYNSWSSITGSYRDEKEVGDVSTAGVFNVRIPLEDYPYDTVYMSPSFSRIVNLDEPIVIKIK